MARVDDFLDLVDNPARHAFRPGQPADDALLALLVHIAFSDGTVETNELQFLEKVLPDRDPNDLLNWVADVGSQPLDIEAISLALPTTEERWKGLRFAARMAWKDGSIQQEERDLLDRLATGLALPKGAVDRVLGEMQGKADERVTPERIVDTLQDMAWEVVQLASGPLETNLASVVPEGADPVARIGLDMVEVVGLYQQGFAAHFLEGPTWLDWGDIVAFSRVPTLGAAVQVHTEDGRTLTLVDARLRGFGTFLARLFEGERPPRSEPPVVERLRGEE